MLVTAGEDIKAGDLVEIDENANAIRLRSSMSNCIGYSFTDVLKGEGFKPIGAGLVYYRGRRGGKTTVIQRLREQLKKIWP